MKRRSGQQEFVRFGNRDGRALSLPRIDRETLEQVMRDDVFLAADGKTLPLDPSDIWLRVPRRTAGPR
jgi:hypothetical protein